MNIVKENEGIETTYAEMSQQQYYTAMLDDFAKGEIIFKRVFSFKKKIARKGNVLYTMKYKKNGQWVYNGAYQFKKNVEDKYLENGKLNNYLLYHLSVELSKF